MARHDTRAWPAARAWTSSSCTCTSRAGRDGRARSADKVIILDGLGARGPTIRYGDPGPNPIRPLTPYAQKLLTANRFGAPYPYEIVRMLTPDRATPRRSRRGPSRSSTSTTTASPGACRPPGSQQLRPPGRRAAHHLHRGPPRRHDQGGHPRPTRPRAWATSPSRSAGGSTPRSSSPRSAASRSSGMPCRPVRSSRWTPAPRTWTSSRSPCAGSSSSPRPAARSTSSSRASTSAASRTGTPSRRCSCTREGILVMTPASAMVLTGKQALDFSGGGVRRRQLRHRRLRPGHGPQRPGTVLGAQLPGRVPAAARALRLHLRRAGRALPPPATDEGPGRPRRPHLRARRRARHDVHQGRRGLRPRDQPRPQAAVRHALGHASRRRHRLPSRWNAGRAGRTPTTRSCGTSPSAAYRSA